MAVGRPNVKIQSTDSRRCHVGHGEIAGTYGPACMNRGAVGHKPEVHSGRMPAQVPNCRGNLALGPGRQAVIGLLHITPSLAFKAEVTDIEPLQVIWLCSQ